MQAEQTPLQKYNSEMKILELALALQPFCDPACIAKARMAKFARRVLPSITSGTVVVIPCNNFDGGYDIEYNGVKLLWLDTRKSEVRFTEPDVLDHIRPQIKEQFKSDLSYWSALQEFMFKHHVATNGTDYLVVEVDLGLPAPRPVGLSVDYQVMCCNLRTDIEALKAELEKERERSGALNALVEVKNRQIARMDAQMAQLEDRLAAAARAREDTKGKRKDFSVSGSASASTSGPAHHTRSRTFVTADPKATKAHRRSHKIPSRSD